MQARRKKHWREGDYPPSKRHPITDAYYITDKERRGDSDGRKRVKEDSWS